jgi:outer membrane protein OmpA-like peptidoglycan-associated protein
MDRWLNSIRLALGLAGLLILAGCTLPGGDKPSDLGPGVGQPFPNLSVVPDRPPAVSPEPVRSALFQQLQNERNSANAAAGVAPGQQLAAVPAGPVAIIYFGESSSTLSDRDTAILGEVARMLSNRGGGTLRVVGHASLRGDGGQLVSEQAKDKLASRRAGAIANALYQQGVARSNVRTTGTGTTQPEYQEINPNGIAGNRRAEIFLES